MSWVSALPMCQEMSMVMATEAYEINKSKTGHPVHSHAHNIEDLEIQSHRFYTKFNWIQLIFSYIVNSF